jgi:CRISPR/Cas system-associated protein Cas7 (RAMP superfamily)
MQALVFGQRQILKSVSPLFIDMEVVVVKSYQHFFEKISYLTLP